MARNKRVFISPLNKARGLIIEIYGSCTNFARELGITPQALSFKLSGETDLKRSEIAQWSELLEVAPEEIPTVFFPEVVKSFEDKKRMGF